MITRLSLRAVMDARLLHWQRRAEEAGIDAVARQMRKQGYTVEQAAAILSWRPRHSIHITPTVRVYLAGDRS